MKPLTEEQIARVKRVMPMARGIARRWAVRNEMDPSSADDLFGVAYLALCEAAPKWRPDGAQWFAYAEGAVQMAVRNYVLRGGLLGATAHRQGVTTCDVDEWSDVLAAETDTSVDVRIDLDRLQHWLADRPASAASRWARDVKIWQEYELGDETLRAIGLRHGLTTEGARKAWVRISARAVTWPGAREAA